jgi:eukaryotic-like serine/threonine-protein kinase
MSSSVPNHGSIGTRYEIKGEQIGQGGMGVVYRAYDTSTKRDVALKTLRGTVGPQALELFAKEWTVLASLSHPNIVDILDSGEFDDEGQKKPFFVMPLLPGVTLEALIREASPRLSAARVVEIMTQASKGLQAAHEHGLVHRDLKPSNIFVMDDDSVKIIDFGVLHLTEGGSLTGLKGTLIYMSPEQIALEQATAASDIFSLGVVCYESLTGRKPFARENDNTTAQALRHFIPPPASEINSAVSPLLSRVVHKAMAKQPAYRFSSAREFADALQKALRNEPIEGFDPAKISLRIERVKKASNEGDYQFAGELLRELESEGHIDPEISALEAQIQQAMRQKSIRQLLDSARTRLEEEEYPLALQKIQDVLNIDPDNTEARLLLTQAEQRRGERQIDNWFRLVRQHMDHQLFGQARQGLEEILKIHPGDTKAQALMSEVDRREEEFVRNRREKEQLYQSAIEAYQGGEVSTALHKLEQILELGHDAPGSPDAEREAQYQSFYNQVRSERDLYRNGYTEGQKFLIDKNFKAALDLCSQFLQKYPDDPLFQALKLEVEEQLRQEQSAFVGEVNRRIETEADLDRKVNILREAAERFPAEPHFQQSLRLIRERRDLVNSILAKARQFEQQGQYADALGQWDILRNIYAQYPGLDFEVERLRRRREGQARDEVKARWVEQIDRLLEAGEYARAQDRARDALAEFPDDRELAGLERVARQGSERSAEAERWLEDGKKLCFEHRLEAGLEALKKAGELDGKNPVIRSALLNALLEHARSLMGEDWHAAEPLIEQALDLDQNHPGAKSLKALVADYKKQETVEQLVWQARELQADGKIDSALDLVERGLASFPNDPRLTQLRSTLRNSLPESRRREMRERYLEQLKALVGVLDKTPDEEQSRALLEQSRVIVERYPEDADFRAIGVGIENRAQRTAKDYLPPAAAASSEQSTMTVLLPKAPPVTPSVPEAARPSPEGAEEPLPSRPARQAPTRAGLQDASEGAGLRLRILAKFRKSASAWPWVAAGFAVLLVISAFLVIGSHRKPAAIRIADGFPVELNANTSSVTYLLDGQPVTSFPLKLPKGAHRVEAFAEGYESQRRDFTLQDGTPTPVRIDFQLAPAFLHLRFSSDLTTGKVSVDNQEPALLEGGGFAKEDLTAGEHSLKLLDNTRELLSVTFKMEPGEPPVLTGPIQLKEVSALVITSLGGRARVYSSGSVKGNLKDQPPQALPPDGLALTDLNSSNSEFEINDGKNTRPFPLEIAASPHLNFWINSDRNVGMLSVEANVSKGQLIIDGRPNASSIRNGKFNLNLEPKTYRVRIVAPGYEDSAEQSVAIHKGEPTQLKFELKPAVNTASLVIEGGIPESEVWLNGERIGTVSPAGSLTQENINPGSHTIQIRKQDYEELDLARNFVAKQVIRLAGDDAKLKPLGGLDFRVSPAGARVIYKLQGEPTAHSARNNQVVRVKAGSYEVEAQAEKFATRTATLAVASGKNTLVDLNLPPAGEKKTEASDTSRTRREPPIDPATWKLSDEGWWVHAGPTYAWLKTNRGVFDVEIRKQSGKVLVFRRTKKVEWVVDYKNEANLVAYSLDTQNLSRKEIVGGKGVVETKIPLKADLSDTLRFQIEIVPNRITVRSANGSDIDVFPRPNATGDPGRFGFRGDVELKITER